VILALVSTIAGLVLLLGFKTQSASSTASKPASIAPSGTGSSPSSASPSSSSSASGGSSSSNGGSPAQASGTKTVTGESADTRWGPVQVKITVTNGKITSAEAVDYPQNNPRDMEINSWAIPQLQQETITANSANIDMLSGATYTSQGYVQSLQSALDKV
jgi:uncharacterized protein with FMN-binding domain